ncbi:MAG TPA: metal-dependent hydrolase [Lentisphaeria bacterium]|nr:metal-dependent hydrolase [Lentisphaeria bacterium]
MKVTWFGHSFFTIESSKVRIAIDPFIEGNKLCPISAGDIEADYICITHGHADHVGSCVEIAKRCGSVVISNPEICEWLANKGAKKNHSMQIGGSYLFQWGKLKMTMALHSSPMPDGSYGGNPMGMIFEIDGKKIYHAGDTGLFGDMKLIGEEKIDLALLPIGDNYTMGSDDALKAIAMIKPSKVIPMHFNTFDVIKQNPVHWIKEINESKLSQAIQLSPGESITL